LPANTGIADAILRVACFASKAGSYVHCPRHVGSYPKKICDGATQNRRATAPNMFHTL
jgi:hypothetical protein